MQILPTHLTSTYDPKENSPIETSDKQAVLSECYKLQLQMTN